MLVWNAPRTIPLVRYHGGDLSDMCWLGDGQVSVSSLSDNENGGIEGLGGVYTRPGTSTLSLRVRGSQREGKALPVALARDMARVLELDHSFLTVQ